MLEPPASKSYSTDWINRNGTLILADIQITSGNNDNPADVVLAFDCFCEYIQDPLLVGQDARSLPKKPS
jgi:hypothetical protein